MKPLQMMNTIICKREFKIIDWLYLDLIQSPTIQKKTLHITSVASSVCLPSGFFVALSVLLPLISLFWPLLLYSSCQKPQGSIWSDYY